MLTSIRDVYVVSAMRTPVGKAGGMFKQLRADDLLACILQGLLAKLSTVPHDVFDDVIIGCAMPEGEQGMNVARISSLLAGIPEQVPAMTINRFCASGLQSISQGANLIACGQAESIIAGGVESMSRIPMGGYHYSANPAYFKQQDAHLGIAYSMGITAEKVASRWNISRDEQDDFAYQSHVKAQAAIDNKLFNSEILPVTVSSSAPNFATNTIERHKYTVDTDEGPRANCNKSVLANLRTVFATSGSITAGNSSQMSDGAGVVLLASKDFINKYNLTPLARFCGFAVAGVAPEIMGIGPVQAIPKVLQQTGLNLADIQWIELNEAFAAQTLAVINELKLDVAKVNPQGGAIALGHPLGATGAIRVATLLHGLRRNKLRYGMVTMCIGTGMGAAGIFESCVS